MTTNQPKQPPVATLRDGAVSAKVWRNISSDGKPHYSTTLQRTYTDPKTGAPRESQSFQGVELLKLQLLAKQAYVTESRFRERDRQQEQKKEQSAQYEAPLAEQVGLAQQHNEAMDQAPDQPLPGRSPSPTRDRSR